MVTAAYTPEVSGDRPATESTRQADVRPWTVMHATEQVRPVLDLAEAQRAVGMRPVLVTPAGYGSIELYLRAAEEVAAYLGVPVKEGERLPGEYWMDR